MANRFGHPRTEANGSTRHALYGKGAPDKAARVDRHRRGPIELILLFHLLLVPAADFCAVGTFEVDVHRCRPDGRENDHVGWAFFILASALAEDRCDDAFSFLLDLLQPERASSKPSRAV